MADLVAECLAAYRRTGEDAAFERIRGSVDPAGLVSLPDLIEADAAARRLAGRPCTFDRWNSALATGVDRSESLDAAVTAAIGDEWPPPASLLRSISQRGPEEAAAVARVRLVRELLTPSVPDEGVEADAFPDAPCDFGPPFAEHPHRFRLHALIARGAASRVYEATDWRFSEPPYEHRTVLKLLPRSASRRAVLEILRARRVHHPGILQWLDGGIDSSGLGFVVSELVPGRALSAPGVISALGVRGILAAMRQVAEAVQAAHESGILHLDISPSNILVDEHGAARLCDFGAARPIDGLVGVIEATPMFAAPEVLQDSALSAAADIYALGAVLRWCCDLVDAHDPAFADRDAELRLERVWARAMRSDPAERHPTARAFAADLDAWLSNRPLSTDEPSPWLLLRLAIRRDPLTWGLVGAALLALGVLAWLWTDARLERAETATRHLESEARRLRARAGLGEYIARLDDMAQRNGQRVSMQVQMLQWIAGARGIDDPGLLTGARNTQRLACEEIVRRADAEGEGNHLEARLAELSLSVLNAEDGRFTEARDRLATALPWWRERIAPDDPSRRLAEAVADLSAFALESPLTGEEATRRRDRLAEIAGIVEQHAPSLRGRVSALLDAPSAADRPASPRTRAP